jgi:hypothetical protein
MYESFEIVCHISFLEHPVPLFLQRQTLERNIRSSSYDPPFDRGAVIAQSV